MFSRKASTEEHRCAVPRADASLRICQRTVALGRVKPTLAKLAAFAGLTCPARAREWHLPERPGRHARAPVNLGLVDGGSCGQAAKIHVTYCTSQSLRCAHAEFTGTSFAALTASVVR